MKTDVAGRVRNTSLAASKPLLPLFEAVVNSMEAIQDGHPDRGRISITIIRDRQNLFSEHDAAAGDVVGFHVTDNGVGFDEANYAAFETSDTTYKAQRGGKGVGRFLWLVAFERVEVESHFIKDGIVLCRRFEFVAQGDGVRAMSIEKSTEDRCFTIVRLLDFRAKYRQQCPKRSETIASHLIEHCLEYFIRPDCPEILLIDSSESQNLNDRFEHEMAEKSVRDRITVDNEYLFGLHVRLHSPHIKDHQVHFCANGRVVKSEKLLGQLPNLARRLHGSDNQDFVYAAYIDGDVLDDSVNAERTDFAITEDDSELLANTTTWQKIRSGVLESCRNFLTPYTDPVREKKRSRIESFVTTDGPMYRPILKYVEDKLDLIDPEINDDALDLKLYQAYHDFQVELKIEGNHLMQQNAASGDWEEFERQLGQYIDKVSDVNKSDLARYVCHRRAILDFLHKQLSVDDDGRYRIEERVHQIIFPLRCTSDDVTLDDHNLWLVDEKLVYHVFLASDKPLRANPKIAMTSQKEPDIVVFDRACVFATEQDGPYSAITIIEFKRPMRNDYDDEENPFVQVRKYIIDIREGKARTSGGRNIPIGKDIPFFCYVICDNTPTLEQQAYDFELTKTADGQGFFGYKRQYNAYFEFISYTKLVTDAKKRNAAFFDKLGLPTRIGR